MANFRDELSRRILLSDGAVGTYLNEKGVPESENRSLQCIRRPDLVLSIYREYLEAGADIIRTNTFDANPIKLREQKDHLEHILQAGVDLALKARAEASKPEAFIAGSIGPLGVLLRPYGIYTFQEMGETFMDLARTLIDRGVDLIVFETFTSLLEIKAAITAVRKFSDIPILGSMTFNADGFSALGDDLYKSMVEIHSIGTDVSGINCFLGPKDSHEISESFLRETRVPFSVMPNAGIPTVVNRRTIYLSNPEYFKEYARVFARAGANIIGSCCGTTPAHTLRMREVIDEMNRQSVLKRLTPRSRGRKTPPMSSGLEEKLGREFTLTVEVAPPKTINYARSLERIRELKSQGVDAINVTENPLAKIRMSPSAFSRIILEEIGIEPILHFTLRDRNLLAIQSDLLGAYALGIKNIFAIKGDPSIMGDFPAATTVYDVDTVGLIRIVKNLNEGKDIAGKPLKSNTAFFCGAAANPSSSDPVGEAQRLREKVAAGARFIIPQPVFDVAVFARFLEEIGDVEVPVLAGLMEIKDLRYAQFLNNEVPGFCIPAPVIERLAAAKDDGEGMRVAIDLGLALKPLVSGLYLVSSSHKLSHLLAMVEALR